MTLRHTKTIEMIRTMKEYADESSWVESEGGFTARNGTKFKYKIWEEG